MNKNHLIREGDIFQIGDSRYVVTVAKENRSGNAIFHTESVKFKKTGCEGESITTPNELYGAKFIGNIMDI